MDVKTETLGVKSIDHKNNSTHLRVLFVVEGNTDIRFLSGLSEICDLTVIVPEKEYHESGLEARVKEAGLRITVDMVRGNRLEYQKRCLNHIWRRAAKIDIILAQEVLRGALNSCIVGWLRKRPVMTYMCMPPVQYYRCRRARSQIGPMTALSGEVIIRSLMRINGVLATRWMALGPYLFDIAFRYSSHTVKTLYYGVDTEYYRPVSHSEQLDLRRRLDLPREKFLILLSSRISHEKDPETVLRATAEARAQGLDAAVLNLGGGYRDFLQLAKRASLPNSEDWVLGRPAAHPMRELAQYYQASNILAQASLEEGAGMAPLEALACGIPAVCTAVGGLARILPGYARLVPRGDSAAMAREFQWVATNRVAALEQALQGREYVANEWSREQAFSTLSRALLDVYAEYYGAESRVSSRPTTE